MERLDTAITGRDPLLRADPFTILAINKMFRSLDQIERERAEAGKRNPLPPSETLGMFLEVAWAKRPGRHVFFAWTKNGRNHRLPLGPMAAKLLRRRQTSGAEESARRGFEAKSRKFVFPARSKKSKSGHYSDATTLLDALRDEAGIEKLPRHDLRRSFRAMMTSMDVPEGVRKRFFNHADASVTETTPVPSGRC